MGLASKILNPPEKKAEPDAIPPLETERPNSALPPAPITEELIDLPT